MFIMKYTIDLALFSHILFKERMLLNIGIREAAKQIGISPATLSRCENENVPTLISYVNICKWLKVSMEKFIVKPRKM